MNTDRALEVVTVAHDQLAAFASKSHRSNGRGVVQFSVAELPPERVVTLPASEMSYRTLNRVRRLIEAAPAPIREEDADVLIRMLESVRPGPPSGRQRRSRPSESDYHHDRA